jgi:serine/threonine protein phosphatase PrpC
MESAVRVLPALGAGQDRAMALPASAGYLVAVADGAGGSAGGAAAADSLIAFLSSLITIAGSTDWGAALRRFDQRLSTHVSGGQTTGVVAFIDRERVIGASVGDCEAWLLHADETSELTVRQHRKPLLGSGEAVPVGFVAARRGGRLLMASDGLFKYASSQAVRTLAVIDGVDAAVQALVRCVRLPSGALQDDVAVVMVDG